MPLRTDGSTGINTEKTDDMTGMERVEEIREELRSLLQPLISEQTEAMKRCQTRAQIEQCIEAYGHLHTAMYDQVRQMHGLPPIEYRKNNQNNLG